MTSLHPSARWQAPVATTGVWALAIASAAYWGLRLSAPMEAAPPPVPAAAAAAPADPEALARLLGVVPTVQSVAPEAASRFALIGVVADGSSHGAALISIDGKPARPLRVGAKVGDGHVLQSVTRRTVTLGPVGGGQAFSLQLPAAALAIPTSANLAPAGSQGPTVAVPVPRPMPPAGLPPPVMAPLIR